jgi:hypothetical protein
MAEALKIIVARDGWKGLRRGMSARVVTFAPSTAISWASYEFFSESSGGGLARLCTESAGLMGPGFARRISHQIARLPVQRHGLEASENDLTPLVHVQLMRDDDESRERTWAVLLRETPK